MMLSLQLAVPIAWKFAKGDYFLDSNLFVYLGLPLLIFYYPTLNMEIFTDGDNGLVGLVPAAVGKSLIPVACDHQ